MAKISADNLETEQETNKDTIHGIFINLIKSKLTKLTVLLIWEIFERLIKTVCVCVCICVCVLLFFSAYAIYAFVNV